MRKKLRKMIRLITSRVTIIALLMIVQILFLLVAINVLSTYYSLIQTIFTIISLLVVLFIVNKQDNPAYKLAWVIPISLFPIFGGLLYIILGGNRSSQRFIRRLRTASQETTDILEQEPAIVDELRQINADAGRQSYYINHRAGFPIYKNTATHYFPTGEDFFETLIQELNNAKDYIFMEFFIIEEGVMWDTILAILKRKVKEGVDVRLLYDDMGCLFTLPFGYYRIIREYGIKCVVFNHFIPLLSIRHNHRDHRKIIVIDGHTAFTGGCNLADEYINGYEKHGRWKDTMVRLRGDGVYSFTIMFLQTWKYYSGGYYAVDTDLDRFRPPEMNLGICPGYVQPYGDSPLDMELVGQTIYINMISCAKKYVYIVTPYLVVGDEMLTALEIAAKSGVDVRIITPHVADKAYVHTTTRSYYEQLLQTGVRIYEYTPGFIHSKTVVLDDEVCTVGTINFDYRSLYLHFECGVWMYDSECVEQVKEDFNQTLLECQEIRLEDVIRTSWPIKFIRSILRLVAPLM